MNGELFRVLDWEFAQWRKAIAYYNQCHPKEPFTRPLPKIIEDCQSGRTDAWINVQKYWKERRVDEPNEVKLILPGETA